MSPARDEAAELHEPSYYEIALTNRQVVVAFVILLVCLLTAFFSGVWLGRTGTLREQATVAANLPAPVETPVDAEGRELRELEFFQEESGDRDRTAQDPVEKRPAAVDSRLVEDVGEAEPAVTPAPPAAVPVPEILDPAERRKRRREERAALESSAQVRPTPRPAPPEQTESEPARGESPTPPAPVIPAGRQVIQVLSSPEREKAEQTVERLKTGGLQAFLSPVEVGGLTMYRVRVGPFASREAANKVAERIRKEYRLDTWVTE